MAMVLESPAKLGTYAFTEVHQKNRRALFLAGGITWCPNWQEEAIRHLVETSLVIFNPRRAGVSWVKEELGRSQMEWEHWALNWVNDILFWFPKPEKSFTVQPISFFELGGALEREKLGKVRLFIGVEDGFSRKEDVLIQCELAGHRLVYSNLQEMCKEIIDTLPKSV